MARPQARYACQQCGAVHTKWTGRCEGCGAWNSLIEELPREALPKLDDMDTIAMPIADVCVESQEQNPHRARLQVSIGVGSALGGRPQTGHRFAAIWHLR